MVFKGIAYNFNHLFVTVKTIFFGYVNGFFTTRFFNNINVMFIEDLNWFVIITDNLIIMIEHYVINF